MTSGTGPSFLGERHVPWHRVRCPVHNFIYFSPVERLVIDHPIFQRLRYVRQLALTHYVYPGATHTRFEHSLGVMELVSRAFDTLLLRQAGLLADNLSQVPELQTDTLAKARQLIRLMGLLHDIGHTAFSHAGEGILPGVRHEAVSAWAVSVEGPLGKLLDECLFEGAADLLSTMLAERELPPQLVVLKRLVSSHLDMDRTDYLLRDSLSCGVEYGRFDYQRLISSLVIHESPDTQTLAIGVDRGGFHAFEGLLLARYYMNTQVYFHRVRRAYDLLLRHWLDAWGSANYDPLEKVLEYDDLALMALMRQDVAGTDGAERQRWAARLLGRDHPKLAYEWGDFADGKDRQKAQRVQRELQARFPGVEFLLDDPSRTKIHDLYVQGDPEPVDDLFVIGRDGKPRSFSEHSKIVGQIPKHFWVIRLFGYFASQVQREEVERVAHELAASN